MSMYLHRTGSHLRLSNHHQASTSASTGHATIETSLSPLLHREDEDHSERIEHQVADPSRIIDIVSIEICSKHQRRGAIREAARTQLWPPTVCTQVPSQVRLCAPHLPAHRQWTSEWKLYVSTDGGDLIRCSPSGFVQNQRVHHLSGALPAWQSHHSAGSPSSAPPAKSWQCHCRLATACHRPLGWPPPPRPPARQWRRCHRC